MLQSAENNTTTPRGCYFVFIVISITWASVLIYLFLTFELPRATLSYLKQNDFFHKSLGQNFTNVKFKEISDNSGDKNLISSEDKKPILSEREYHKPVQSIVWKFKESKKTYENSTPEQYHGQLPMNLTWMNEFKVPLIRPLLDPRHQECQNIKYKTSMYPDFAVIFIFSNEILELLLRSVYSVLNRTPPELLREIILVDDKSTYTNLMPGGLLDNFIVSLPKTRIIHLEERLGIVGARLAGIRAAKSEAFVVLDSHIEVTKAWLEPIAHRINQDPRVMIIPKIGGIINKDGYPLKDEGISCNLGIIWSLMEHGFEPNNRNPSRKQMKKYEYQESPTMSGGLFAAHKQFFFDIGSYDEGMLYWGAENIELSFRLWQCGGRLECTECSHIYHMFYNPKLYSSTPDSLTKNRMRTAAVWMDKYSHLAWNVLNTPPLTEIGNISKRVDLRKKLNCHNFQWFLDNVWPESSVRNLTRDVPYLGIIKNVKNPDKCFSDTFDGACNTTRFMYFRQDEHIHKSTDDEFCVLVKNETTVDVDWCKNINEHRWIIVVHHNIDGFEHITIQNKHYLKCLELENNFSDLTKNLFKLETCDSTKPEQLWSWPRYPDISDDWIQKKLEEKQKTFHL